MTSAPSAVRSCQGLFVGPAKQVDSALNHIFGKSEFSCPLSHVLRLATELYGVVISTIVGLFIHRRPSAIVRSVIPVNVVSFDGVTA